MTVEYAFEEDAGEYYVCLEQRSPIKHGAMVLGQMYMSTKGNILLNEYCYNS